MLLVLWLPKDLPFTLQLAAFWPRNGKPGHIAQAGGLIVCIFRIGMWVGGGRGGFFFGDAHPLLPPFWSLCQEMGTEGPGRGSWLGLGKALKGVGVN